MWDTFEHKQPTLKFVLVESGSSAHRGCDGHNLGGHGTMMGSSAQRVNK